MRLAYFIKIIKNENITILFKKCIIRFAVVICLSSELPWLIVFITLNSFKMLLFPLQT